MKSENGAGRLYVGHSKGAPADCIIRITDQDMTALAVGELDPVRAFMTGKLKIKGNLMATQRLQCLFELNSAEMYEKDDELMGKKSMSAAPVDGMHLSPSLGDRWGRLSTLITSGSQPVEVYSPEIAPQNVSNKWMCAPYEDRDPAPVMLASSGGGGGGGTKIGPIIDLLFEQWLPTRLDELKELVPVIKTVYQWNILQSGKVASVWTLDLKNGDGAIHRGEPKTGKAECILSIEDDNAVKIFEGKEDAMRVNS